MNRRILTLVTLTTWSVLLLWFWLGGRVASYLHPQFHAYVAAAGIGLALLAPLWWWATRTTEVACGHCGCHGEEGHDAEPRGGLSAGAVFAFTVLLLPVSAAAFISPSQFGEAAVMNRGIVTDITQLPSATPSFGGSWEDAPPVGDGELPDVMEWPDEQEEGVEYFTRAPDGSIQLETIDLLFAADEPGLREVFENQRVSIVGQYVPPRGGKTGGFDLVRMFVVCCAADARPLGINIVAPEAVEVPRMGWVRITGVARFTPKDGRMEPSLELEKIDEVEAPRETFLY
jgi:uncharacterized repeat protein (TIGR03943 family)